MRAATVRATAIALPVGYLLGSVPVAVLVGRRQGVDPRAVGDRNPGYWNVKEQLGRRRAAPVFAGDALKGALAAGLGRAQQPEGTWGVGYGAVAAAMVGHAFPAFAGFRGGRSVLTFVGGMCVLSPEAAGVAAAACAAVTATTSFAWGARVGVFGFPLAQLVLDSPHRTAATGALMTIIGLRFAAARRTPGPATSPTDGARSG